ncbi:hypothetical protein T265_09843 [Opisthorchis viverrini]|uniref:Uncharacterized protein n=1 Tax=Opisthorchis viverrini TaxID=6198 RepID=A0A074Z4F1_OPIVI|nr:hypothetical protein T265_09843 [Opisthorchis viverrini]KER21943.1 hypothetical protein T265_09843 [Opisthorchis viverrini]
MLQCEKAEGQDGLNPALFKEGGKSLVIQDAIWDEENVPEECGMSTVIPIFKKVVRSLSRRQLTAVEENVLIKGLNFNFKDASDLEYMATLEAAFKSSDLNEETQQAIRQTIVPAITRNKTHNALLTKEKRAVNSLKADGTIVILPGDKGIRTQMG